MAKTKNEQADPWCFQEQLKVGSRGEELLLEHYPGNLAIHPGHDGDFICLDSGDKIELNTDTYNIDKTDNFFIERWSSFYDVPKKPGGVWQARDHGCSIFIYYFVRHNLWYQFNDIDRLKDRLEDLTEGLGFVFIKNKAWTTAGYKVKRTDLEDLYDIYEF